MATLRAAASKQTLVKTEPGRAQRHKIHTDAIFGQLMEAHTNSKRDKDDDDPSSSQLLTVKNFGARTGLHWPEGRVAREIVGLIGGFTREQEDKLTQMRNNGRAVADTLASTEEFNGRGNPDRFPHRSRQQIAAKLLDMFGDVELKSIVPARADTAASRSRGGTNVASSSTKVYVYQDERGPPTPKPGEGTAATAVPPSPEAEGSNMAHGISDEAYVPAASGYNRYPVGRRYYRDQEPFPSTSRVRAEPAKGVRFSPATTRTALGSRFSEHGAMLHGGDSIDSGGDGDHGGFEETNRQGACDGAGAGVMGAVGLRSVHRAGGGGDGRSGMGGGRRPSRLGGVGYHGAVNGAGYLYPRSSLPPEPWSPTPTRDRHMLTESPAARDGYTRESGRGEYTVGESAWNGGDVKRSAGFRWWLVPPSSPSDHPAVQKASMNSSSEPPPEVEGPSGVTPRHSPLAASNRFASGRSTKCPPPPPPPPPAAHPRIRFRKKPRIALTTIFGAAMPSAPCRDGPTAAVEAPGPTSDRFFNRRNVRRSGTAAEGATDSLESRGLSKAACAAAYYPDAGGTNEKQSSQQLVKVFPSSVSRTEQRSLRLAFGSALTEEAWVSGTSTLLGVELNLD